MEDLKERTNSFIKKIVGSTKFTVLKMFVLGLGLYLFDMGLDGNLGLGYLNERNCHPKLPVFTIPNVKLSDLATKDLKINSLEFRKPKYIKAFHGIWGKEQITDSVWFGDIGRRINIMLFPGNAFMGHIYSIISHVFGNDIPTSIRKICSFNNLSLDREPDELFLHFCDSSMTSESVDAFRAIFKGVNKKEKQLIFRLLKVCDIPAVIDALEQSSNIFSVFGNNEVKNCINFVVEKDSSSLLLKLYIKRKSIALFIREAGLRLHSNWQHNMYYLLDKCWKENVVIECINKNIDDCPSGNLQYGTLTLGAILLPGILFAVSEFSYCRCFPFGGYTSCDDIGKMWPFYVKCFAFPFYAMFMSIFLIFLTILE